jgi:hypothetical protein
MYCYICAQKEKETPAVGMCVVCGMFLCKEHALRHDLEKWQDYVVSPVKKTKVPRILCGPCYEALK